MSVSTTAANGTPSWGSSGASSTGTVVAGNYAFTVKNNDNTSTSSNAYLEAAVGGTSAGSPQMRWTIPSGTSWIAGPSNTENDRFVIGTGTTGFLSGSYLAITASTSAPLFYLAGAANSSAAVLIGTGATVGSLEISTNSAADTGGNIKVYAAGNAKANVTEIRSGATVGHTVISGGKSIANVGLGVGNSANATVAVGTLAKKFEVFDAAGASLGFVPVYATIT